MTNEEAKAAWRSGVPTVYGGIEYHHISALIYRRNEKESWMELELYDKCGHAVVIARPNKVELVKEGKPCTSTE